MPSGHGPRRVGHPLGDGRVPCRPLLQATQSNQLVFLPVVPATFLRGLPPRRIDSLRLLELFKCPRHPRLFPRTIMIPTSSSRAARPLAASGPRFRHGRHRPFGRALHQSRSRCGLQCREGLGPRCLDRAAATLRPADRDARSQPQGSLTCVDPSALTPWSDSHGEEHRSSMS